MRLGEESTGLVLLSATIQLVYFRMTVFVVNPKTQHSVWPTQYTLRNAINTHEGGVGRRPRPGDREFERLRDRDDRDLS